MGVQGSRAPGGAGPEGGVLDTRLQRRCVMGGPRDGGPSAGSWDPSPKGVRQERAPRWRFEGRDGDPCRKGMRRERSSR